MKNALKLLAILLAFPGLAFAQSAAYNLSQLAQGLQPGGIVPPAQGGTGLTSVVANECLVGNSSGTGYVFAACGGGGLIAGTFTETQVAANYPANLNGGKSIYTTDFGYLLSNGIEWKVVGTPPIPAGAAMFGYTQNVYTKFPVQSEIVLSRGSTQADLYAGLSFNSTQPVAGSFGTDSTTGQLELFFNQASNPGAGEAAQITTVKSLNTTSLVTALGNIPPAIAAKGFHFEAAYTIPTDNSDSWDAFYLLPWQHNASNTATWPGGSYPACVTQFHEFDINENGHGTDLSGFYRGNYANWNGSAGGCSETLTAAPSGTLSSLTMTTNWGGDTVAGACSITIGGSNQVIGGVTTTNGSPTLSFASTAITGGATAAVTINYCKINVDNAHTSAFSYTTEHIFAGTYDPVGQQFLIWVDGTLQDTLSTVVAGTTNTFRDSLGYDAIIQMASHGANTPGTLLLRYFSLWTGPATGASGNSGTFQANGTNLSSSSTVNFENGQGIVVTNPSAGNVQFASTAPSRTVTASPTIASTDMGGTVYTNVTGGGTVTIPAISSSVLASGMTVQVTNYSASTAAVSSTPTINSGGGCVTATGIPSGTTWYIQSNGTTLDCVQAVASSGSVTSANIFPAQSYGSCSWTPASNPTTDVGPCINLAIAAAAAAGGGTVTLPPSDAGGVNGFGVTTPIVISSNGIHLVGAGLQYSGSSASTSLIATSSFSSSGTMVSIAAAVAGEISNSDIQGINLNANNYALHGLHVTSLAAATFDVNCMNAGGGGPSSPTTGTGAHNGGAECLVFDATTAGNGNQNIIFRRLYGSTNNYAKIARFDTGGSPGAKNTTNSSQINFDEIFINMGNALGDGIVFGDMDNIDVRGSVRCQGGCKGNAVAGTFGAGLPFVVAGGGGQGTTGLYGGGWTSPDGVSTNGSQQHPQIRIHHTSVPIYVGGFRESSTITQLNGTGTEAPTTVSLTATTNGGNWPAAGTDVIYVTVDPTTIGAVPGMVVDCGNGEMDSGVPRHDPIVATNAPSVSPYFVQLLHPQISLKSGGIQNSGTVTSCTASYGITKYAAIGTNGNNTMGYYNVGYFTGTGSVVMLNAFTGTATSGTYTGVSLTGGSGTGAVGTVTVTAGAVTNVAITTPGTGYTKGNVLSFTVTGGTGTATVAYANTATGWAIAAPAGGDSQSGITAASYTGSKVLSFTDMVIPLTTASPANGDIFQITTTPAPQEIAVNGTDYGNGIALAQFQPGSSGTASYEVLNAEAPFKADTGDYPGTYQGWNDSSDMQAIRNTNNGQGLGNPLPYWLYEFGYRDYGGVGTGLRVEGTINSSTAVTGAGLTVNIDCYAGTGCASGTTLLDIGTNSASYWPNGVSTPSITNHDFTLDSLGNGAFLTSVGAPAGNFTNLAVASGSAAFTSSSITMSGAISSAAALTNGIGWIGASPVYTDSSGTGGTITTAYMYDVPTPSFNASVATTYTTLYGWWFGNPTCTGNATCTNRWGLGAGSIRDTGALEVDGAVSGSGMSNYLASPPAIGGTAPAAVTGTTVTATTSYVHGVTVLCQSGAAVNNSALTNTSEDSLAVCTVPAGVMGTNGMLRVTVAWLGTATATTKTINIRYASAACTPGTTCATGTNVMSTTQTSSDAYAQTLTMVRNLNANNSQAAYGSTGVAPYSAGYASVSSTAVNNSATTYLNINCTDGTTTSGTEYCGIQGYTVELVSP